MTVFCDTETYSATPINRGTDVYTRACELLLFTWAVDDGPVHLWDPNNGKPMPNDLLRLLHDDTQTLVFHNVTFDRQVLKFALQLDLPIERFHCTMAQALAHGLPAGLSLLCKVMNVPVDEQKHEGRSLIHTFCKPKPGGDRIYPAHEPAAWKVFCEYAKQDVVAMRECYKRMPKRNYRGAEYALWCLDQKVNERGVQMDAEFATAAVDLLTADTKRLNARTEELTDGAVARATQRDKLLEWMLLEHDVVLPDLQVDTLERLLEDDRLPQDLREVIKVRILSSMASTSKFSRLLRSIGPDGRLRHTLQFDGAGRTGRWAGRMFQPHNLPRPSMHAEDIEHCIWLMKQDAADLCTLFADSIRGACSNALRGLLIPAPDNRLVVSDWSNIEGRMVSWLANEHWKLEAFRAFDRKEGPDVYCKTYGEMFDVDPATVKGDNRQIGKVVELSMGYEGAVGAFVNMASVYGVDFDKLAQVVQATAPEWALKKASSFYAYAVLKGMTLGLSKEVYIACRTLVELWRHANADIANLWKTMNNAVVEAMAHPGARVDAGRVVVWAQANWLCIELPSGRTLMYANPKFVDNNLTYMGTANKQWRRIKTHGGKLVENITQAASRDILAHALPIIENHGFRVVMHVHDEVITEVPDSSALNVSALSSLMTRVPDWAAGLPLAAAGFEGYRYAKH